MVGGSSSLGPNKKTVFDFVHLVNKISNETEDFKGLVNQGLPTEGVEQCPFVLHGNRQDNFSHVESYQNEQNF